MTAKRTKHPPTLAVRIDVYVEGINLGDIVTFLQEAAEEARQQQYGAAVRKAMREHKERHPPDGSTRQGV